MSAQLNVANQVVIFAIFAISLNLLMGYTGQASIAQGAFGAVGGYTVALFSIHLHVTFLLAILLATGVGGLIGLLVGLPALGLAGEYLILLTIAVAFIVIDVASGVNSLGGTFGLIDVGAISIGGHQFRTPTAVFPLYLAIGLVVLAFAWRVGESPFGRVLRAIREDESAARSLGKRTLLAKVIAFSVTSGCAALAGGLFTFYYSQISPNEWSLTEAVAILTMVVIGGSGNLFGSIIGAIVVVGATPVLEDVVKISPGRATFVQLSIYSAIVILVMIFRPAGVLPERRRRYLRYRRDEAPGTGVVADQPMSGAEASDPVPEPSDDIVVVSGLVRSFGGIRAVDDVDFSLARRRLTVLIGPNGAGKSTVFSLLTGFTKPERGRVSLNGVDLAGASPSAIARSGMVRSFQDVKLFRQLTSLENVMVAVPGQPGESFWRLFTSGRAVAAGERRTVAVALRYLESVGLAEKADRYGADLSHGEQKLLAIARVLATEADVLLLDEPTSGIDPLWVDRVADAIRRLPEAGRTVCVVEHNLAFVARLDARCIFLDRGHVEASGSLRELMDNEALRNLYFGTKSRASVAQRVVDSAHVGPTEETNRV